MKRITDKQRLDALEKEALREPIVLHDIVRIWEGIGRWRGLGLKVSTGRTLRQAIDQAFIGKKPVMRRLTK